MPGVVMISGIVPAAISLPLPSNTGAKIPLGVVRIILGLSVSAIPSRSMRPREGLSRFDIIEYKEVRAKQGVLEFLNGRNVVRRTVCAVAEADANVSDYRPVPSAHLARLRKLLGKVRLNDNQRRPIRRLRSAFLRQATDRTPK